MPEIIHICYPGVGGQAAVATGLAVEGQRAGVSHGVIFYGVEQTADQYQQLCDEHGIEHHSILKRPGFALKERRALARIVKSMEPNMIISHHHDMAITVATAVLMRSSVATIFVEHHSNALKTAKDWALSTLAHRLSEHTVYLTEFYRDQVGDKIGRWFDPTKSSVIANGLDLTNYQFLVRHPMKVTKIGMQGRMDEGKDFETLLRAFAQIEHREKITLELIGDGPERGKLEQLAQDLGVREQVKFFGFLSQQDLIGRIHSWDLALLITMGETLSMAILEAWALGIPLISTKVPGVVELIHHDIDGILVEPSKPSLLAAAIQDLIDDHNKRERLSATGRERVEKEFNRARNWRSYLSLCEGLAMHDTTHSNLKTKQIF